MMKNYSENLMFSFLSLPEIFYKLDLISNKHPESEPTDSLMKTVFSWKALDLTDVFINIQIL